METRSSRADSQQRDMDSAKKDVEQLWDNLNASFDDANAWTLETVSEDEIRRLKTTTDDTWIRYVSRYDILLNLMTDKEAEDMKGLHAELCSKKARFDVRVSSMSRTIDSQLVNVVSSAVSDRRPAEDDVASVSSRSSNMSVASIQSKTRHAKQQIDEAQLELEFSIAKAKLLAAKKIGQARDDIDNAEIELLTLQEAGLIPISANHNSPTEVAKVDKQASHRDDIDKLSQTLQDTKRNCDGSNSVCNVDITQPPTLDTTEALRETVTAVQRISLAHQLPTPEIIKFDGTPKLFPMFKLRFQELVMTKPLDEAAKFSRLMQFVTDNAKRAIEGYELSGAGKLQRALDTLEHRFGQPYLIASSCIRTLVEGPAVKPGDRQRFRELADSARCTFETLKEMKCLSEVNNENLAKLIMRTPAYFQRKWRRTAIKIRREKRSPALYDIVIELEDEAEILHDPVFGVSEWIKRDNSREPVKGNYVSKSQPVVRASTMATSKRPIDEISCPECKGKHGLVECDKFKARSQPDRFEFVRSKRLCFKCLTSGHQARRCTVKKACEVENCKQWHATLLHPPSQQETQPNSDSETPVASQEASVNATDCDTGAGVTSLTQVLPIVVYGNNGKQMSTYALLDSGSDISLCDQRIVDTLGLAATGSQLAITTVNSTRQTMNALKCNVVVSAVDETIDRGLQIKSVWAIDNLNMANRSLPNKFDPTSCKHLQGITFPRVDLNEVSMIIGADCPEAVIAGEFRKGNPGEPWAVKTKLGWSLFGPVELSEKGKPTARVCAISTDVVLQEQVEQFWAIERLASENDNSLLGMSVEDQRALNTMDQSVKRVNGHYELALPWRDENSPLPNNHQVAADRLKHLKRRLQRDKELHDKYKQVIDQYLVNGFAEQVQVNENESTTDKKIWYLPHHPVFSENKPGKVRVVFDAAAKFKGTSLNERLLQGPDLTNLLVGVLLRFRMGDVAFSSDVEAMFHQVRVTPKDRDALRFLWWPNGNLDEDPVIYRMCVHVFGATSSPSCANFALRKTAEDNSVNVSTQATEAVRKSFYVDDALVATRSEDEATELIDELSELLKSGGFRLTKWLSNKKEVLETVEESERAASVRNLDLDSEKLPTERALGVLWDAESDCFKFKGSVKERSATKRGILSMVSSMYDPLGFISPCVFKAKLILQSLWRDGVDWDESISGDRLKTWSKWLSELHMLSDVNVKRNVLPVSVSAGHETRHQLHIFADASLDGYGAVAYLRTVDENGSVNVSFLMGKTRLAPIKSMTVPRLELQAAVMAVRLKNLLVREMNMECERIIFWTDSTTVLKYLKNESTRFSIFVTNRVNEIRDSSVPSQWRYVPTKENPADDASRGLDASELHDDCRWLIGPKFLCCEEKDWPTEPEPVVNEEALEITATVATIDVHQQGPGERFEERLFNRYSSWSKLKLTVAWLLRYKAYLMNKDSVKCGKVEVGELKTAEHVIVQLVQERTFADEIKALKDPGKGQVSGKSSLLRLNPILDGGLLRVGGRISGAPISFDARHPLILPKNHSVSKLIAEYYHVLLGHVGQDHVLSSMRQRYWMINARSAVRKIVRNCFKCLKEEKRRGEQLMAPLPATRVTPYKPAFCFAGVDYFGPLKIKQGRSTLKRYGCLFTCFNTRAVHIEVAESLETDSFICALRRFACRRGMPEVLHSDRGTNFVGAKKELKECLDGLDHQKIAAFLRSKACDWKLNPPAASHQGGVWERLIRSVKKTLHIVIGDNLLTHETLTTWLIEVEAILNGRPLTPFSDDPKDEEPLTPNHLLLQQQSTVLPPGIFDEEDGHSRKRWRQAQYLADRFWARWIKEYLPLLQQRRKWNVRRQNFKVDDLVIVVDDTLHRNVWPLGRVTQVFEGRDGCVRTLEVKTKDSKYIRPITKICNLEGSE